MKKLNQTIFIATTDARTNSDSIQKIQDATESLKNRLEIVNSKLKENNGNSTKVALDTNAFGEWQVLMDQKVVGLRNELENTTNSIMDKMFEKDNSIGKKMRSYDNKILNVQNEYIQLQSDIQMIDQASKTARSKFEDQVRNLF